MANGGSERYGRSMTEFLQLVACAVAVLYGFGVLVTLIELWRAPHGFEDEDGFHVVVPGRAFSTGPSRAWRGSEI